MYNILFRKQAQTGKNTFFFISCDLGLTHEKLEAKNIYLKNFKKYQNPNFVSSAGSLVWSSPKTTQATPASTWKQGEHPKALVCDLGGAAYAVMACAPNGE